MLIIIVDGEASCYEFSLRQATMFPLLSLSPPQTDKTRVILPIADYSRSLSEAQSQKKHTNLRAVQ